MKRRFTILTAALTLLAFLALPMGMWGQTTTLVSGSGTSGYSIPEGWTSSGTVEGGSYLKFDDGSITSPEFAPHNGISFTYSVATFGSGTNHPLTIRILNASTNAVISEMTTDTPTSSSYINTGSPLSLGDVTVAFKIQMYGPTGKGVRLRNYSVTGTPAGGQQLTPSDLALVNAPVELEFDLYDNANAQTISYTTSSTGAVTVSQSNYITATVNANNTITVTPVAVTNGPQTITINQAADNTYAAGSVTFTVDIEDSTPSIGTDVTFDATQDLGNATAGEGTIEKGGVTFTCSNGILGNGSEYRLYKNSVTTFSVASGTITKIVFTCPSGNPASGFATQTGWTTNGSNGTWTGNAASVSFTASGAQVRATQIVVTVETSGTPDPTISASNVDIAYNATSGSITYTINNEPSPAGTLTATVTEGNWLTLGQGTTSPIAFTCTANENTTARTAMVTLTYTYNTDQTVTANVTVTQAAVPESYTTIPALFAAATSTETPVYVTFDNWVVSGVSTNGKNVFVTDNNGNGFVIFDNNGGLGNTYTVGDILAGTAVSCDLKKYNGFAELLNVDANDLTITNGGTVTVANVAMADLAGVNTGALVSYENLTCSVDDSGNTTKYYLSDGTTTLQVYNALFAFEALVADKHYNITGVYQQYNSTKEIMPRSAEDIEEVEIQHEEYTLTVSNLSHVNLFIFGGDESESIINTELGENTAQVYDGTNVEISVDVENGYVIQSLVVDGTNVTSQIDSETGMYVFTMPTHNVTVTATAVENVAPAGGNYVRITSLDQLTDGSKVIIAARYNSNTSNYVAMKTTLESGKASGVDFISTTSGSNEILPASIVDEEVDYYWTVGVTNNVYTFTSSNGDVISYNSSTNFNWNGNQPGWTITTGTAGSTTMVPGYAGFVVKNEAQTGRGIALNENHNFGPYAVSNMTGNDAYKYNFFLDFFVQTEETPASIQLEIEPGQWYLIASPVGTVDPTAVDDMTTSSYALYRFDQQGDADGKEWINYKNTTYGGFSLEEGKGYLYANQSGCTLTFMGTPIPFTEEDNRNVLELTYEDTDLAGYNLLGNPFNETVWTDWHFYVMGDGDIIESESSEIAPMQGFFVIAEDGEAVVTLNVGDPIGSKGASVALNVSRNRGNVIDRARVRFGESRQLPKLQLFENSTKVYIPQNGKDYAVVRSEGQGELPVNFRAAENGTYTLSIDAENMDMNYLHLIDNMTGMDIDLLQTPSYTFEANENDYESRFRLVFAGASTGSATDDSFAFYSNGSLIINNEGNATLQVVDLTGRILSSESVNGSVSTTLNAPTGVYMLRLINGDNVKVQKIVVR